LSKREVGFGLCNSWPIINQLHILTVRKQRHVHFSFHIVLCLTFHVHHRVKNIFKHIVFYMHDIQIMMEDISFPIRKLPKNSSFYLIVGHIKTRKLLSTKLKTKHNALVLQDHIMQFFTRRYRWWNIPFDSTYKEISFILYVLMIDWKEYLVTIKKKMFYHYLLRWRSCYFLCSMNKLVFHTCSN